MTKKELRQYIRTLKHQHTDDEKARMSNAICGKILSHPRIIEADTILAYWSLSDEVYTHALVDTLWRQGKQVLLPKVISDTEMTIHEYSGIGSMVEGAYGIMEPTTPPFVCNGNEEWVAIVPGMSFSPHGHRLGRGKGYYDRLLHDMPKVYKIGICFPFQLLEDIPHDEYDVQMHEVLV